MSAVLDWDNLVESMAEPGNSEMQLANNSILGASALSPEQLLQVRNVFGSVEWLSHCFLNALSVGDRNTFMAALEDARQILVQEEMPEEQLPLKFPVRKGTTGQFNQSITHGLVTICTTEW